MSILIYVWVFRLGGILQIWRQIIIISCLLIIRLLNVRLLKRQCSVWKRSHQSGSSQSIHSAINWFSLIWFLICIMCCQLFRFHLKSEHFILHQVLSGSSILGLTRHLEILRWLMLNSWNAKSSGIWNLKLIRWAAQRFFVWPIIVDACVCRALAKWVAYRWAELVS